METLIQQAGQVHPGSKRRPGRRPGVKVRVIYRMPGNEGFDQEEILRAHREATIGRTAGYEGTIPAVQDTTGVNYNTHLKTEGTRRGGSTSIAVLR
jgi:hypothetical protein